MWRTLTLTACAFALVGCSTTGTSKPKACDGHSRRPVNIYGSILPGSPVPAITAPVTAPPAPGPNGKPAKPAKPTKSTTAPALTVPGVVPKTPTANSGRPAAKPRRISALPQAFASCGQGARG